jgi:hypothetical protein
MKVVGAGLIILAIAAVGVLVLPEVFYPNLPHPRGPHVSEVLGLGGVAVLMLAIFRWVSRHEIRVGRISLYEHPKPISGWDQWAYHVDPFGKVLDD